MSESRPGPPLRIAVLGDFEGVHTRRWLEVFVRRGHDVHAISYYRPSEALPNVTLHVLSGPSSASQRAEPGVAGSAAPGDRVGVKAMAALQIKRLIPTDVQRIVHMLRYWRAGLADVLDEIRPHVFHAHYVVEHGFYGSFAGFHPYVVSAWGSDLLVASRSLIGRRIAKRALHHADLVTANDVSLARQAIELGVPEEAVEIVHLGIDEVFLEAGERSVNLNSADVTPPTIVSDRALEPLYNVDVVIRAFARLRERLPDARLIVAHDGSERSRLEALARELGPGAVSFVGRLTPPELAETLSKAHVYVSVPSSDSFALSTVEAMAAGCFPVVSDLPSNEGWLTYGENAFIVPVRDEARLADAMQEALRSAALRNAAAETNRSKAESDGLREPNMLRMERLYYRLAGYAIEGGEGL